MSPIRLSRIAAVSIAILSIAIQGCASSSKSKPPAARSTASMIPATGQAAASVRSYLDAANLSRPGMTQPFLATGNYADLASEFEANRMAGWMYSRDMLKLYDETIDAKAGEASVTARIVVQGGSPPTYMSVDRKFQLIAENGVWKIASMDPPPQTRASGAH